MSITIDGSANTITSSAASIDITKPIAVTGTVTNDSSAAANKTAFNSSSSSIYANYSTVTSTGGTLQYGLDDSTGSIFGTAAYASVWSSPASFYMQVAGVNKAVVSSTGLAITGIIKGSTTIGVGNATPAASGAGITFPATQSASTDANTLDDYEEGTFTPVIEGDSTAGAGTYTQQSGYYQKIGNTVHFQFNVVWTAHNGTGDLWIGGLPFVANSLWVFSGGFVDLTLTAGNTFVGGQGNSGLTTAYILQSPTGTTANAAVPMQGSGLVRVSGFYKI